MQLPFSNSRTAKRIKDLFEGSFVSGTSAVSVECCNFPEDHGQLECGCRYWCTAEGTPFIKLCDKHLPELDDGPSVSRADSIKT